MPIGAPMASAANIAMPVQDIDMPARCGPTEAIDQETQPVTNWLSPKPATRRPTIMMARLMAGENASIAASQHGRKKLDADNQSDDQVAEAELVVDEQRNHRQR